jgi:hypothetical protein
MRYLEMKSSRETRKHRRLALHRTYEICEKIMADLLYPPHMRRLPVKADLPWSTRQLSKTVVQVRSSPARSIEYQMDAMDQHLRSILPGLSWNQY